MASGFSRKIDGSSPFRLKAEATTIKRVDRVASGFSRKNDASLNFRLKAEATKFTTRR